MQGGRSKAQKDKPEGPNHTLEPGWACWCSLPPRGGLLKTLWRDPQPFLGEVRAAVGGSYFLWCVTKLFPSCSNGGVPNRNSKRPEQ